MQVNHLAHSDRGIQCSTCGTRFEVSGRILTDPHRLLEWKEGIAAVHTCRQARPGSVGTQANAWRMPTGEAYFVSESRRLLLV